MRSGILAAVLSCACGARAAAPPRPAATTHVAATNADLCPSFEDVVAAAGDLDGFAAVRGAAIEPEKWAVSSPLVGSDACVLDRQDQQWIVRCSYPKRSVDDLTAQLGRCERPSSPEVGATVGQDKFGDPFVAIFQMRGPNTPLCRALDTLVVDSDTQFQTLDLAQMHLPLDCEKTAGVDCYVPESPASDDARVPGLVDTIGGCFAGWTRDGDGTPDEPRVAWTQGQHVVVFDASEAGFVVTIEPVEP